MIDTFQSYGGLDPASKGALTNHDESEECSCCMIERGSRLGDSNETALRLKLRARQMRKMAKQVKEGAIVGQKAAVFVRELKGKSASKEIIIEPDLKPDGPQ